MLLIRYFENIIHQKEEEKDQFFFYPFNSIDFLHNLSYISYPHLYQINRFLFLY